MKFQEMKELGSAELLKKKKNITQQLFEAKMKNGIGQLANPIEIRDLRKDLARVNTVLTQKFVR